MLSFHAPFVNAGGEAFRKLHLQSYGIRFHRVEGRPIIFVGLAAEATGIADRLPLLLIPIEQLPGFGDAAFTDAGVVKPIDFHFRDFGRFVEIVLDPFFGALMRPPMKVTVGMIAGTGWLALIV